MNKKFTFLNFLLLVSVSVVRSQITPIAVSNHNYDAVAEATTATAHTSGALDGSDYILYSQAYGSNFTGALGLPNSGTFSSGNYTFQMAPYTGNNVIFLPASQIDSLILTTPAAYAGLSLLCFSTEGNGSMNVTIRFTDNTTQTISNQSLTDWFGTGNTIASGFDRAGRTSGTPSYNSTNPKAFYIDIPILCTNRSKNVKNIKFQNTSTGARDVIMAVSGAPMPTFSVGVNPVTCQGGTNGSAYAIVSGGIPPFTYTWNTTPVQTATSVTGLSVGVYSYTATDGGLCPIAGTFAITQSLQTQPSLSVTASFYTICAGTTVTLNVSGASTYTWDNNTSATSVTQAPSVSTTYTVGGLTSANCFRTGSLNITVNPLPVINFTAPAAMCINAQQLTLTASPVGGGYVGQGVSSNIFSPASAGVGTKTLSYTYTDGNNCTSKVVNTIVVNALPVVTFTLAANTLCANSPSFVMNASPAGGTYTGTGVSGDVFSPSTAGSGTKTVYYEYTDANNCTSSITSSVIIFAVPNVTIVTNKKVYCTNTNSLYFNASPSGGTYSGPGISPTGAFSPTLAGAGNHTITYAYTDVYGCSNTAAMTLTVNNCNGLNESPFDSYQVQVFPNPTFGSFIVKSSENINLKILNDLGQLVKELSLNEGNNHNARVNDLSPGIYFMTVENAPAAITKKVVLLR
ncbi:MAG: T9SS type A sorting domain-containing protein [Bacteroidia bacterium]|nr:T9SS type A sorting domain-containing protein [Bacteroidia bacterium]